MSAFAPDIVDLVILPLFATVVYPGTVVPLAVTRPESRRLVASLDGSPRQIGVVAQRSALRPTTQPAPEECFTTGTLVLAHELRRLHDGTLRIAVEGLARFEVLAFSLGEGGDVLQAQVRLLPDPEPNATDQVLLAEVRACLAQHLARIPLLDPNDGHELLAEPDPQRFCFRAAAAVLAASPLRQRQAFLELPSLAARCASLRDLLEALPAARDPVNATMAAPSLPERAVGSAEALAISRAPQLAHLEMLLLEPGIGELVVTGGNKLAREAAQVARSWLRLHARHWGHNPLTVAEADLHLHLRWEARPSGRWGGIGAMIALTMASALLRRPLRRGILVLGDLSLHGELLPLPSGLALDELAQQPLPCEVLFVAQASQALIAAALPDREVRSAPTMLIDLVDQVLL